MNIVSVVSQRDQAIVAYFRVEIRKRKGSTVLVVSLENTGEGQGRSNFVSLPILAITNTRRGKPNRQRWGWHTQGEVAEILSCFFPSHPLFHSFVRSLLTISTYDLQTEYSLRLSLSLPLAPLCCVSSCSLSRVLGKETNG